MRIKYHYFLENKIGLIKFLERFKIPYETCELPGKKGNVYVFDLYEDQNEFAKFKSQFPFVSKFNSIKTTEYDREDIEKAEWLSIRNKSTKVQWEYDEKAFRQFCPYKRLFLKETYYKHSEQIDFLSVTKPVKWGTRQFFSGPNAADDFIFCSEKAKSILGDQWKGLAFWPVKKYNTFKYMADLYQLFFAECLPFEAFNGGKVATCNNCGRKILRITEGAGQLAIDRTYLQDQKRVYKTGNILTEQLKGYNTFSLNIVSQEFYQYCEKYKMNQGMIYEPIRLI